jgi:valyl-tRNA synthetase
MLRLLHPFMPFVTEELWQRLVHGSGVRSGQPISISLASFPVAAQEFWAEGASRFGLLQKIVTAARELRADNKLGPKSILPGTLYSNVRFRDDDLKIIESLAKLEIQQRSGDIPDQLTGIIRSDDRFVLNLNPSSHDLPTADNSHLEKELRAERLVLEKLIADLDRRLSDENFTGKAPSRVVGIEIAKRANYQDRLDKNQRLLEKLPPQ